MKLEKHLYFLGSRILMISVKIRTMGVFQKLLGQKLLTTRLHKDSTVKGLIQKLAGSEINDMWLNALILVNGKEISILNGLETIVSDGDEVFLLPVSHGG
jgi:molybdopterin converting factor small subunit